MDELADMIARGAHLEKNIDPMEIEAIRSEAIVRERLRIASEIEELTTDVMVLDHQYRFGFANARQRAAEIARGERVEKK